MAAVKLLSFRVQQFRSINDSGLVSLAFSATEDGEARSLTALVGRNESGKSNLLLALQTLNPPGGVKPLTMIKNFPRQRHKREWNEDLEFLETEWAFSAEEQSSLTAISTVFADALQVTISRDFKGLFYIRFGIRRPVFDTAAHETRLRKLLPLLRGIAGKLPDGDEKAAAISAVQALGARSAPSRPVSSWCTALMEDAQALRDALGAAETMLSDDPDQLLAQVEEAARAVAGYEEAAREARNQVLRWIPQFIYVSEFPAIAGHQDIEDLLRRQSHQGTWRSKEASDLDEAETNFLKMAKVAGFDPLELHDLGEGGHEERSQTLNRAGAVLTARLRERWKDRQLKVRFNLDGNTLDTLISDPNATYDVEVNLDERSRGFRWFFAFYVTFTADTDGGNAHGAILLLDEPGLFLHAMSQGDLLNHFKRDFDNQIIYTTHSPFMIPPTEIGLARTVNISETDGTVVTNDPSGDERTLFPLQAALGWNLAQSLYIGPNNLLVEGVTDFWILSSVSEWMGSVGKGGLPKELALTPVGGAGKMTYMAALLIGQRLNVIALLDGDKAGQDAAREMVRNRLIQQKSVFFVGDAFGEQAREADIEDLLDPIVYEDLIRRAYKKEIGRSKLIINEKVPRIVKRFEMAFQAAGLSFDKGRPARLFLEEMAKRPAEIVTDASKARFAALFSLVTQRLEMTAKG